jgi:hypothetical protein
MSYLTNVAADKHFSDAALPQWLYCACSFCEAEPRVKHESA